MISPNTSTAPRTVAGVVSELGFYREDNASASELEIKTVHCRCILFCRRSLSANATLGVIDRHRALLRTHQRANNYTTPVVTYSWHQYDRPLPRHDRRLHHQRSDTSVPGGLP